MAPVTCMHEIFLFRQAEMIEYRPMKIKLPDENKTRYCCPVITVKPNQSPLHLNRTILKTKCWIKTRLQMIQKERIKSQWHRIATQNDPGLNILVCLCPKKDRIISTTVFWRVFRKRKQDTPQDSRNIRPIKNQRPINAYFETNTENKTPGRTRDNGVSVRIHTHCACNILCFFVL